MWNPKSKTDNSRPDPVILDPVILTKQQRSVIFLEMIIVSLFLIGIEAVEAVSPDDPDFHCNLTRELYPDLQWNKLKKGDRLETYDAVMTCKSATVIIKSNLPFNPYIQWKGKDGVYQSKIPADMLVAIRTQSGDTSQPKIEVEAMEMSGEVLFSTNRDLIKKYGFLGSKAPRSQDETEKEEKQQYGDLKAIGWEPLTIERQLGPWDMIWTQENGRVEIEILKEGIDSLVDESTNVKDPKGRLTNKRRFPPNSYFIMHPQFYQHAKANKIIGEVWIATDLEKVKEFNAKYKTFTNLGPMDRDTDLKWREMLKKEELE